jgi:excisionase family DNA binding protein
MFPEMYSVEQVAEILGLHVRTVRNYVREGRLKAVRIGKQYRIAREDLATITGRVTPLGGNEAPGNQRSIEVSSIVEVEPINREAVVRLANRLVATAKNRGQEDHALRLETVFDDRRGRLKVILNGSITTVGSFLAIISAYLES